MKCLSKIPAAQYVRMSTDDQLFSIDNQKAAIHEYAERYGFEVVATYEDRGRSGVSIRNRDGLRRLLKDVMNGRAAYNVILVYDVSRWGRFQDVDEAAHYEFLCKEAGIPVRYCAEQFDNDGTLSGSVMKALKRTMAAEYSRELAVKVYQGQKRLVLLGYHICGLPPYGYRRMLVGPDGSKKQLLKPYERKNIKTDRITLIRGPQREVACLQTIFAMGVFKKNTPQVIAEELNREGLKFTDGRPWDKQVVFRILKNPSYTGCNIFGKTRRFTGERPFRVPHEQWVIKRGAFPALVDQNTFDRVQRAIQSRKARPSNELLLDRMKKVWKRDGTLTQTLLKKRCGFNQKTYCRRFGSVLTAYRLIGYRPSRNAYRGVRNFHRGRSLRQHLLERLRDLLSDHVKFIRLPGQHQREVLQLDGRLRFAVLIARPIEPAKSGEGRWQVRTHPEERGLPVLLCTIAPKYSEILNYYVVPASGIAIRRALTFGETGRMLTSSIKLQNLGAFYSAALTVEELEVKDETITVGDVMVTKLSSTIKIGDREIILSRLEASMFKVLLFNAGQAVLRQLFTDPGTGNPIKYLTAHMYVLRMKLGKQHSARIQTLPGQGYMYRRPETEPSSEEKYFSPSHAQHYLATG
jgi:DNA invertase Pin-like site-specific DNA recombinase/DNA-binding winged helix-turn-helix (wHTH) protein